jgi:hypothetical protein
MSEPRLLRLAPSASVKEKRLASLLAARVADVPALAELVEDAELLGSLELAGVAASWDEVRASRRGEAAPAAIAALRRAGGAVARESPLTLEALLAWHHAATGSSAGLRTTERSRDLGPPPAPARFVKSRLAIVEQWLGSDSAHELKPVEAAALALTRIVEIAPFDDGNGRVARLAAAHLLRRGGARRPILVGADRSRLEAALASAFQLELGPLVALLEEASERAVDVMIQSLEGRG